MIVRNRKTAPASAIAAAGVFACSVMDEIRALRCVNLNLAGALQLDKGFIRLDPHGRQGDPLGDLGQYAALLRRLCQLFQHVLQGRLLRVLGLFPDEVPEMRLRPDDPGSLKFSAEALADAPSG